MSTATHKAVAYNKIAHTQTDRLFAYKSIRYPGTIEKTFLLDETVVHAGPRAKIYCGYILWVLMLESNCPQTKNRVYADRPHLYLQINPTPANHSENLQLLFLIIITTISQL